jgi:hypothetical protein
MDELQEGATVDVELGLLKSDRNISKKMLESTRNMYADKLKGKLGKDIDDVLSGKKKVKLSLRERTKYFIDKILRMF